MEYEKEKQNILEKQTDCFEVQNLFKSIEESPSKSNKQQSHLQAFDEALKVQMKQIEELKHVI
jgi:hypothetical protein